ncbi:MAG: cyclase family protein [Pseudomonadales bacterium]|nr:cyclase family protein [Pseudomonadales bacterium]
MKMRYTISISAMCLLSNLAIGQTVPRLDEVELIDLSHAYDDTTLFWPTSPIDFEHNELAYGPSGNGYFYSAYTFATPEHGGTHLDAPIHFSEGAETVGQLELNDLFAPLVIVDVTAQANRDRNYRLQAEDIQQFENEHGTIAAGSAVFIRTGWSRYWPDAQSYLGDDTPGDASNLSFPGLGVGAAELLMSRDIALIGIDTASIDYGPTENFPVHVVLATEAVPALENLTNLQRLPQTGAYVLAAPMKIGEGSGAPARVIAFVMRQ